MPQGDQSVFSTVIFWSVIFIFFFIFFFGGFIYDCLKMLSDRPLLFYFILHEISSLYSYLHLFIYSFISFYKHRFFVKLSDYITVEYPGLIFGFVVAFNLSK
jgi:hypothetical protein